MLSHEQMILKIGELSDVIDVLTAETNRLRHSNKLLRTVNRSLRVQLNIAHLNDELMRELCFPLPDDEEPEGGLPEGFPSPSTGREP